MELNNQTNTAPTENTAAVAVAPPTDVAPIPPAPKKSGAAKKGYNRCSRLCGGRRRHIRCQNISQARSRKGCKGGSRIYIFSAAEI